MDLMEKLIEILEEPCGGLYPACELADYLIANGVTVQELLSRSKRKLLDAADDRIESTIRARTTIDDETIYGFPIRDLVVASTVMRRSGIEPEDLRKLCHNLDFAFNVAWEELEKTIERAMAESQGKEA